MKYPSPTDIIVKILKSWGKTHPGISLYTEEISFDRPFLAGKTHWMTNGVAVFFLTGAEREEILLSFKIKPQNGCFALDGTWRGDEVPDIQVTVPTQEGELAHIIALWVAEIQACLLRSARDDSVLYAFPNYYQLYFDTHIMTLTEDSHGIPMAAVWDKNSTGDHMLQAVVLPVQAGDKSSLDPHYWHREIARMMGYSFAYEESMQECHGVHERGEKRDFRVTYIEDPEDVKGDYFQSICQRCGDVIITDGDDNLFLGRNLMAHEYQCRKNLALNKVAKFDVKGE